MDSCWEQLSAVDLGFKAWGQLPRQMGLRLTGILSAKGRGRCPWLGGGAGVVTYQSGPTPRPDRTNTPQVGEHPRRSWQPHACGSCVAAAAHAGRDAEDKLSGGRQVRGLVQTPRCGARILRRIACKGPTLLQVPLLASTQGGAARVPGPAAHSGNPDRAPGPPEYTPSPVSTHIYKTKLRSVQHVGPCTGLREPSSAWRGVAEGLGGAGTSGQPSLAA